MSEWKSFCLGDVCKFIDYRGKTPPKVKSGVPLVTAKIIKNGLIQEPKEFIAEEFYSEWMRRGIPKKGDVIFTTEAPLGEVAQIKTDRKLVFAQRVIILESDDDILCSSYLFYALQDIKLKSRIEARQSGTTVSGIKASELKKVEVDLPPLATQKKIAAVLSALDDKIELNNAINKNIEEQAQTIFDNFFYDKWNNGNFSVSSLDKIAEYLNGLAMQKFRPKENETGLPVLKIKELRQGFCDKESDSCSERIKPEFIIHAGDVIFSWSGTLLIDFWCGGLCGLNQHLFKVTSKSYGKWFYYLWTKYHLKRFIKLANDMATTMGHIKRKALTDSKVLIPDRENYLRLEKILQPICDKIIANRLENKKLGELVKDFIHSHYRSERLKIYDYLNGVFQQEYVGYRFIEGLISPISDEIEVEAVNEALGNKFKSVHEHIFKANALLSDREKPDYENSIKESISAVEAICQEVLGTKGGGATLGKMLKKLEDNGIEIHSALKEAFNKLYGYTSDANGIRHAGDIGGSSSTFEEAKFMLVSCSAFINYLMGLKSKIKC